MPNSVSFWTTHSGRSPLTGAKATVRGGSTRGLGPDRRRRPAPASAAERLERSSRRATGARPVAPSVGHDDLLAVPQAQHAPEVVGVLVGEDGMAGVVHEDLGRGGRPHGDGGIGRGRR